MGTINSNTITATVNKPTVQSTSPSTTITILKGKTELTAVNTTPGLNQYKVTITSSKNCTCSLGSDYKTISVSNIYTNSAEIVVQINVENKKTYTKTIPVAGITDTGVVNKISTEYKQLANKFEWIVKSGTSSSNMVLTDNALKVIANNINLTGKVTFNSLDSSTQSKLNLLTNNSSNWINAYNRVADWAYGAVSGSTTIDGGYIQTNTIEVNKLRVGDFENYSHLNADTYSDLGFIKIDDSSASNNPWYQLKTLVRDTPLNKGGYYTLFKCEGGGTFRIKFQMSSTATGANNSGDTEVSYRRINIGLYCKDKSGNSRWYIPNGDMSDSSGTVKTVNTMVTLPSDIVSFSVALQIAGYAPFSGTVKIRNVEVRKMADGELIVDGSVTANKINVNDLSAIGATIGGYKINQYTITGTNVGMCGTDGKEWAFWAGASSGANAPFHVGHNGELYATKANISGSITGSSITGSTFQSSNSVFQVFDDGTVSSSDIAISNTMSALNIEGEYLNVPWHTKSLTRNLTIYIDPNYKYPDENNLYFGDTAKFKSFADFKSVAPRNLNGYRMDVFLCADMTENILLDNFNAGRIRIGMRGYTIKGYLSFFGHSMDYEVYGNKPGYTKTTTRGAIVPGANGKLHSDYRYCIVGDRCRLTVYDVDCYAGTATDYPNAGICCINGCIGYLSAIKAVNKPYLLVRCHSASHVYVESSSGLSTNATFHSVSGSSLHLNGTTQAGTTGTTNSYTNNNGKIYSSGVTWDTSNSTGTITAPSTNNTETITKTIKSDTGRSWRTSGSYANSWSSDVIVRQGQWTSSYGMNKGYWFFGNDIYNILQDDSNTITSIKVKITRNSGGQYASVTHYLRAHTIADKPSGTPTDYLGTSVLNKSFGLAVGNSTTISLSSSEIANLKSNKAKGFGLYTSSTAQSGYSCCSATMTVIITYKTT